MLTDSIETSENCTELLRTGVNKVKEELKDIIESERISTVFQPIICLRTGDTLGYEALSRGPSNSFLEKPRRLFNFAKKHNMLFELERVARKRAIINASSINRNFKIFINVDPLVICDKEFKSGITKGFLEKNNISQKNIVIELTEKTIIENYSVFKKALNHYREQGYKIAIDDTGAGYSGLQSIVSIPFNYIKIDHSLISGIDKDPVKQALLEAFVKFSRKIKSKIIAEGIETRWELKTLIELGVDYGQGFLISRPGNRFLQRYPLAEYIGEIKQQKSKIMDKNIIGDISLIGVTVSPETESYKVTRIFENNSNIQCVVVLSNNKPVGLVTRDKLYHRLSSKYGYAVYMDRPIKLIMNKTPMVVETSTSIFEVSQRAMARATTNIYDCIIVTREGKYYGIVSIKNLLEQVSIMRVEEAKQRNPLTNLPGNPVIEYQINSRLAKNEKISVLYIDLDNFKPYNDCYGYKMGDKVIEMTSMILEDTVTDVGNKDDFIGHIGGDDFVVVTSPDKDLQISKLIIDKFDDSIKNYINKKDQERGHYICSNRSGVICEIPLTAISIAIVSNEKRDLTNHLQISDIAAELKKYAKKQPGSSYVKDRRN
ncbi:MAG: GGDEF domain-containing protein [Halothermotrichaceae bacterium]